jgi:hypothetical protein
MLVFLMITQCKKNDKIKIIYIYIQKNLEIEPYIMILQFF